MPGTHLYSDGWEAYHHIDQITFGGYNLEVMSNTL